MRSPSGKQKREVKRKRRADERRQFIANNPTPYEGYADVADAKRFAVTTAVDAQPQPCPFSWTKDKTRSAQPVTVDDLAIGRLCLNPRYFTGRAICRVLVNDEGC
jgi:hypothetical protein